MKFPTPSFSRAALGAAVLAAALYGQARGETYYVAEHGGRDDGVGSAEHPWRSVGRAESALHPGDRLVVREGRYQGPMIITASGSPQRPIEVLGQGFPLIEADQDAIAVRGSYVELRGFEAHATGWGSAINIGKRNHHVKIIGNIARDSGCGGISAEETDYLLIEGNRVFGNARRAPWQCSGISLYQPQASDQAPGFHNVIRFNRVYDNMNVFVDNNVSHSEGRTTDGNGIIVDDADHTQGDGPHTAYTGATLIMDNIAFNNGGRGVHVFHSSNVAVVNNVLYNNLKDANLQRPAAELSAAFSRGVVMADNIVAARPGEIGLMDAYTDAADLWDFNLVTATRPKLSAQSPVQWGGHILVGRDPLFVRPGLDPDADFRVRDASPASRAGAALRLGGPGLVGFVSGTPARMGLSRNEGCCGRP
jgi:parallel beta-helix repeat protein